MPLDLHNRRKRILVRPDSVDGLFSSSGNAVVTAIAFVRTVGGVLRWFQLGKINVLTWDVLNGRIRRFAERQGVAGIGNHTARDGHDNASGIALDGNRMIWTWKLDLLFFHVSVSSFVLWESLAEHGSATFRLFFCGLILNDVPMLDKDSVLNAHNIRGNPIY